MANEYRQYMGGILQEVYTRLLGACDNVFVGHRPATMSPSMKKFLIVSMPLTQYDINVQQQGTGRIEVVVKNKDKGIEDTKALDELTDKVFAMMPIVTPRFTWSKPKIYLKGDDGLGYTIWLVNCVVKVNTTDKFQ